MPDYHAVLNKTLAGLPNNTPEMRSKVYEKARATIRRQLDAVQPALPAELAMAPKTFASAMLFAVMYRGTRLTRSKKRPQSTSTISLKSTRTSALTVSA